MRRAHSIPSSCQRGGAASFATTLSLPGIAKAILPIFLALLLAPRHSLQLAELLFQSLNLEIYVICSSFEAHVRRWNATKSRSG